MSSGRGCLVCGKRLGDRRCPGLDGPICSLCCGTHRRRSIACPPTCSYLVAAEKRLRERRSRELSKAWEEFAALLHRRDMGALIPYMELIKEVVAQFLHRYPASDVEVMAGLRYVAQRLSPIELVEPGVPKFGELLERAFLPLVQEGQADPATLREAFRGLATFVEYFEKEGEEDRFVTALLGTYPPEEEEASGLIVRP